MNRKVTIQLVLLLLLLGGAGWMLRDKLALISPRLANKIAAWKNPPPVVQPTTDAEGNPIAIKPPEFPDVPKEDLAPLSRHTKPLLIAPAMPPRKAPVVVMAPWHGPNDTETSTANLLETMIRTYIRATPKDRLLVNLVPHNSTRQVFYRENGDWTVKGHGRDKYLDNAKRLDADFLIYATASNSGKRVPTVTLNLTDLRKGSTTDWQSTSVPAASTSIAALLKEATRVCATFAGVSEADIKAAGMLTGLPSDKTWDICLTAADEDYFLFHQLLQDDPDCVYLYEVAWHKKEPLRYIDQGLRKWPDDPRLLRAKANILANSLKRHHGAWIIRSELLRRYPDSLLLSNEIPGLLATIYDRSPDSVDAPPTFSAGVDLLRQHAKRFPGNWLIQWDFANAASELASYMRGTKTYDKIPGPIRAQRSKLHGEAVLAMNRATELQPNSSELWRASMHINFTAGYTNKQWQKDVIQIIHKIDPSNVRAEMIAAYSHGVGWGDPADYMEFIELAVKNHQGDARAMNQISHNIGTELSHQLGWKEMTPEQVYGQPNPMSDLFIQCTEYAMDNGVQVDKWVAGMLREMYRQRYGEAKVKELVESGKHWALTGGAAAEAHAASDWERCLRLARLSEPHSRPFMPHGQNQYYIVKSLWKLGRHEEALKEARDGILRYPDEQTFHYMFAVVANEKGAPLDEAYKRAYRAIDISTTNTGANETFEKIRQKLNKPPHPKLKG